MANMDGLSMCSSCHAWSWQSSDVSVLHLKHPGLFFKGNTSPLEALESWSLWGVGRFCSIVGGVVYMKYQLHLPVWGMMLRGYLDVLHLSVGSTLHVGVSWFLTVLKEKKIKKEKQMEKVVTFQRLSFRFFFPLFQWIASRVRPKGVDVYILFLSAWPRSSVHIWCLLFVSVLCLLGNGSVFLLILASFYFFIFGWVFLHSPGWVTVLTSVFRDVSSLSTPSLSEGACVCTYMTDLV